ncbi:MAG TPA: hypothetical protein VNU94_00825 [Acidobacteriaceae bacterium]|nr:hypothetical protein [Acidobacteriaceae bacterium]
MNRLHLLPAALLLAAAPLFAQTSLRAEGVSHPPATEQTIALAEMPEPASASATAEAKPSADIAASPDITTPHPMRPDPDAGIVTYVPSAANELPIGTLIKVRMNQTFDSSTAVDGTPFTAYLSEPVERDGKVIIPAGAEMRGTIQDVHSGARVFGRSSLRLQADMIMLPDGSHYIVNAQVIDTDQYRKMRIDNNGDIVHSAHVKSKSAVMTVTAGSGALVGAAFGGAPGALIGASIGASLTTVHWLRQDKTARLPVESRVTFSLTTSMPMIPLH